MSADMKDNAFNLDSILTEVGAFGLFQVMSYILIFIPSMWLSSWNFNYVIMANELNYRYKVHGCDSDMKFDQPWLSYAIATASNGRLDNCFHYGLNNVTDTEGHECNKNMFNTSIKVPCTEFVYASDEKNLQTEFNIHCSDTYKLAFPGTTYSLGALIALPLAAFLSDKYGRVFVIINAIMMSSISGTIKAFVTSFPMYIALELFESMDCFCALTALYVLSIEWAHSKYRILISTMVSITHPLGSILLAFVAMHVHDFRTIIKMLYPPGLLVISYFWLLPESFRWQLVTGRVSRGINSLKTIARVNGNELSSKTVEIIKQKHSIELNPENELNQPMDECCKDKTSLTQSFMMIFRSNILCGRLFVCCYQWIACSLSYYGLSQASTHISMSDRYLHFMLVAAIEIPGMLITQPLLSRFKRRESLILTFSVAGISIIATPFIPEDNSTLVLICFLLGKASMTAAFTIIYIFTAEQWPTNLRSTMMNFRSMVGRIGTMIAPIVVVLDTQYHSLPALLFAGTAIVAAFSTIFSPETFSKKLPGTIEESEQL